MIFKARNFEFDLSKKIFLMGILNVTPDSFSDGGQFIDSSRAIGHALKLEAEGADIIDIGAESSRPGAPEVATEEQLSRLIPVLEGLDGNVSIPISVDTTNPVVARECLERGASIINDISGFKRNHELAQVVQEYNAGCVLMHMRGTPETMQNHTDYSDLMEDIKQELMESLAIAKNARIPDPNIVVDPGIGFSKTQEQNFSIIRNLETILELDYPVLVGPSRKSFLKNLIADYENRLFGTAAAVAISIQNGAHFIRVHDVHEMDDVAEVSFRCREEKNVSQLENR